MWSVSLTARVEAVGSTCDVAFLNGKKSTKQWGTTTFYSGYCEASLSSQFFVIFLLFESYISSIKCKPKILIIYVHHCFYYFHHRVVSTSVPSFTYYHQDSALNLMEGLGMGQSKCLAWIWIKWWSQDFLTISLTWWKGHFPTFSFTNMSLCWSLSV